MRRNGYVGIVTSDNGGVWWCGHTHQTEHTTSRCVVRTEVWVQRNHRDPGKLRVHVVPERPYGWATNVRTSRPGG